MTQGVTMVDLYICVSLCDMFVCGSSVYMLLRWLGTNRSDYIILEDRGVSRFYTKEPVFIMISR